VFRAEAFVPLRIAGAEAGAHALVVSYVLRRGGGVTWTEAVRFDVFVDDSADPPPSLKPQTKAPLLTPTTRSSLASKSHPPRPSTPRCSSRVQPPPPLT
jgi:hypothetical protein